MLVQIGARTDDPVTRPLRLGPDINNLRQYLYALIAATCVIISDELTINWKRMPNLIQHGFGNMITPEKRRQRVRQVRP